MNNKIAVVLQNCYADLFDEQGYPRKEPEGFIKRAETSEKNIGYIAKILSIILSSNEISIETKLFIENSGFSIKAVNEEVNRLVVLKSSRVLSRSKPYGYNYTLGKVEKDSSRLNNILGNNIINDIIYNRVDSYVELNGVMDKFISIFGDASELRKNLDISIQDDVKFNSYEETGSEDFFSMLETLENYIRERKNIIERAINSDQRFIAYFNYLLSKEGIGDSDSVVQRDRKRLIMFLENKDYSVDVSGDDSSDDSVDTSDYEDDADDDLYGDVEM